jgi:hypothetical protein
MKIAVRMRRWTLMALLCLLVAATPVLMQAWRAGAWSGDPTANTAICTASGIQQDPQITSDGSGGAIMTWQDERSGNWDLYARRVDSGGNVQWTTNGVAICTASGNQANQQITSDNSGGAIITWQDERSGNWDIYAQRVDSGGNVQWTTNGVAISAASNNQMEPEIVSDGSGGAIITWIDRRSGNHYDVYAQRVDSSGTDNWTADGVPICTASGNHAPCQIASDGSGGAIITWEDDRAGYMQYDVYAQKVDSSGTDNWTADGVPVCTNTFNQMGPLITSDGSGGAIITWTENDYLGFGIDIRAQRVDSGGTDNWTADGVPICTDAADQWNPEITSDSSGGAIITWEDSRGSDYDIYAQRVDSGGTDNWTADGVAICSASGDQQLPHITSDGSGGAVITWYVYWSSPSNDDIYAQRVDSGGTDNWTTGGVAICSASNIQQNPQITSDGSGGAVITWEDSRNSSTSFNDIYAQGVSSSGSLAPPTVTLTSTATSPTKTSPIPMTATFSEDVSGFVVGDITVGNGTASNFVAVSGSVYTFDVTPTGQGAVTVDVHANVADGNTAATQFRIIYDSVAPTITLTSTATSPTNTSPIPMTATFSENVAGFVVGAITVGNGTASNFVAMSGSVYTFDVTPSVQGPVTVNVAAGVAQDAAANGNTAATQFSITYDALPTVKLTSTATSPTKTSPIPMTATFSENVTDFVVGDITVVNGTASNFVAVSGTVYTFDVTPSGQGPVTVDIAAGVAQDNTSNSNLAATQSVSITYDSVAPTVTLTSTATSPTKNSPIPMMATFSENVTGFVVGDITLGNGTAGNFTAVSGSVYTFDVTPSGQGAVTVNVAADVVQDAAGNPNGAATQSVSVTYDTVAPTVTLTSTATSPTKTSPIPMTVTFSKVVTGFAAGDVTVGNGTVSNFTAVSGSVYTFDVTPSGKGAVTVNVVAGVAQDAATNGNAAGTQFSITYESPSTHANWGLIGGIIAAILVLALVLLLIFVRRRKAGDDTRKQVT